MLTDQPRGIAHESGQGRIEPLRSPDWAVAPDSSTWASLICHGVLAPRAPGGAVVVYGRRVPEPTASTAPLAAGPDATGVKTASPRAWSWAALMHRAFGIDMLACAHCGGRLRLIATLHDPAVIRKILAHLALGHSGQSPGRAPPESGAAAS
jgi:hypothetical protein